MHPNSITRRYDALDCREGLLKRYVRTAVGSILLAASIGGGFVGGRSVGARLRPRSDRNLLPWSPGAGSDADDSPSIPPNEVFASVLDKVEHDFVGSTASASKPVSNTRLTDGAIGRIMASLQDPNALYFTTTQSESLRNCLLGHRFGIGADLTVTSSESSLGDKDVVDRYLTVRSVAPGSPAERAGLTSGDHITEIDGRWIIAYSVPGENTNSSKDLREDSRRARNASLDSKIKPGLSAARAMQLLTTGAGRTIHLTVESARRLTPKQLDVATRETVVSAAEHRLVSRGVTYLRINQFNAAATEVINETLNRNQDWVHGLIIDLRQNPGGVTSPTRANWDGYLSSLDLMGYVVQDKIVAQMERSPGSRSSVLATQTRPKSNVNARIAVLVDSGTSNIAEMAASGMREAGGAKLFGCRTFGDNVLPLLTTIKNGGALELPTAHLFSARGYDFSKGVLPDYDLVIHQNGGTDDPVLRRAEIFVASR